MAFLTGMLSELQNSVAMFLSLLADMVRQEMPLYYARSFLHAVLVFIPGFIAAEAVRYLGRPLLAALRFEPLCAALGVTALLRKWRADWTATAAAVELAFWLILLSAGALAVQQLAIGWLADWGRLFFSWTGAALLAVAIQAAAWAAGRALAGLILAAVEHPGAHLAAGLAQALLLSLGLLQSLVVLGWARDLAQVFVLVTFSAAALAVALGWALNRHQLFETVIRVADTEEDS